MPVTDKDHGMKLEQLSELGELLVRYARSLGLHGVMIMSPKCPNCGECHDFGVFTDITDNEEMAELLSHYADVVADEAPTASRELGGGDQ